MLSVDVFGVARFNQRYKKYSKLKENINTSYDFTTKSKYILPSLNLEKPISLDSESKDYIIKPLSL